MRSEITDSVNKQLKDIGFIGQCVAALETAEQSYTLSTDSCRPMPVVSSVNQLATPNVGLPRPGMDSIPAGTPVVTNCATVSTTNIVIILKYLMYLMSYVHHLCHIQIKMIPVGSTLFQITMNIKELYLVSWHWRSRYLFHKIWHFG